MITKGLYNCGNTFIIGIIHSKSFITGLDHIYEIEFSVRCSGSRDIFFRRLIKKL